jgi:hypothetical protein
MVALAVYLAFLGTACAYALVDWRRGWYLVLLAGVLQDPVRKLTPGSPVWVSFLVVVLWFVVVFGARQTILVELRDFGRRFGTVYTVTVAFIFLLIVAAINGVVTFGFEYWKVPLLSLFTYLVPLVAAMFGYSWLQREQSMTRFLQMYAGVTAVALIGTLAEYFRVKSPILGMVAYTGDYVRHLPGIQIRLLSGIYRGPDVMALHAATLTSIAIAMALRAGVGRSMLVWGGLGTWGFVNCMLAGRRKAIYFVGVFVLAFLWRYARRVRTAEIAVLIAVLLTLYAVVHNLSANEATSVYTRGAVASEGELRQRFEGGALETLQQTGLMGVGLGAATQGVYHLLGERTLADQNLGWQEGGLGKLAAEVGLPGILAIALLLVIVARLWLRLTSIPDVPGSSQFLRATLFGLVVANSGSFIVSAQAYSDAVLALTFGFLIGCLFATAALDERLAASEKTPAPEANALAPATA